MSRYVRLPVVLFMTGLSRSEIYRKESSTPSGFPARRKLGPRAVAWDLAEIEAWLASRERATLHCKAAAVKP